MGSVFSPHYARARRKGPADPMAFCAINAAFYTPGGKRWVLTEYPAQRVRRSADAFALGDSAVSWDGTALTIRIQERTAPLRGRVAGTVRITPAALTRHTEALDEAGRHRWSPIAPVGRAQVSMRQPQLDWTGAAYLDSNEGDRPLEDDFVRWDWSRAILPDGAALLYDAVRRDGGALSLALRADAAGRVARFAPPAAVALPATRWRVARGTRADPGPAPEVRHTLEDTPFYARSVLATRLCGHPATAMHESLSLDRFRHPVVQRMLPFKILRRRS